MDQAADVAQTPATPALDMPEMPAEPAAFDTPAAEPPQEFAAPDVPAAAPAEAPLPPVADAPAAPAVQTPPMPPVDIPAAPQEPAAFASPQAPPPQAPAQQFAPPVAPPVAAQQPAYAAPAAGGIQYQQDETFMPEATQQAVDQYYQQQGGYQDPSQVQPGVDYGNMSAEEIMALEDPYAPPVFNVEKGRKPPIEMNVLLPKVAKIAAIVIVVIGIVYGGFYFSSTALFLMHKSKADKMFAQERLADALVYYEKCTHVNPNKITPYVRMAEIHSTFAEKEELNKKLKKKEFHLNEAAKQLNKAIDIAPNDHDALYELCSVYQDQEKYEQALTMCRRALQVKPNFQAAAAKKSQIEKELGR